MSLLLEALKKAEKAKRGNISDAPSGSAPGQASASDRGLALEMPSPPNTPDGKSEFSLTSAEAGTPPSSGSAQAYPEISLADLEPPEPLPAQQETARAESAAPEPAQSAPAIESRPEAKTEPVLSLDFPEPAQQPALPAIESPPAMAEANQAGMGGLSPNSQKSEPPRSDNAPATSEPRPAPQSAPTPIPEYSAPPPPTLSLKATAEAGQARMGDLSPNSPKLPSQEAAKKILAAKQNRPKRNLKLLGGMLIGSMMVGAAAYYYWQAVSQPVIAFRPPPQVAMPPATMAPVSQSLPAQPVEPVAAAPQSVPARPNEVGVPAGDAQTNATTPQTAPVVARLASSPQKPERKKAASADEPGEVSATTNANAPDGAIKIRHDAGDAKLDPLLAGAYQAFMAGETGKAETDYRKALQQTPDSRDALLGLAAIAASRGQREEAASHYLRVLQLDPRDAAAQAGLIGLRGNSDPTLSESRLKTLLAQYPDTGYLHFALGNLYAHHSRWSEAQEAYFNAFHAEPGNADYAFNLAVSLDHLDQRKPALAYYQRALALAKERSAGFDGEQLKKRIYELQSSN
jgi:tetratricopeptide (TPR) repeat protein